MAEKEFVFQTVDVLNLNIFSLQTKTEVFRKMGLTIIQLQEQLYCGRRLLLAVVGESHFFCIEGLFLELLACIELENKKNPEINLEKVVRGHDLNGLNFIISDKAFRYAVSAKFIPYQPQVPVLFQQGKKMLFLQEDFPFYHQGQMLPCWTQVCLAELAPGNLWLQTSHSYPPDYIVLTESNLIF